MGITGKILKDDCLQPTLLVLGAKTISVLVHTTCCPPKLPLKPMSSLCNPLDDLTAAGTTKWDKDSDGSLLCGCNCEATSSMDFAPDVDSMTTSSTGKVGVLQSKYQQESNVLSRNLSPLNMEVQVGSGVASSSEGEHQTSKIQRCSGLFAERCGSQYRPQAGPDTGETLQTLRYSPPVSESIRFPSVEDISFDGGFSTVTACPQSSAAFAPCQRGSSVVSPMDCEPMEEGSDLEAFQCLQLQVARAKHRFAHSMRRSNQTRRIVKLLYGDRSEPSISGLSECNSVRLSVYKFLTDDMLVFPAAHTEEVPSFVYEVPIKDMSSVSVFPSDTTANM